MALSISWTIWVDEKSGATLPWRVRVECPSIDADTKTELTRSFRTEREARDYKRTLDALLVQVCRGMRKEFRRRLDLEESSSG